MKTREKKGWRWKAQQRNAIAVERLLNLHRLCVVNEPDIFYAFARARENYKTRNEVSTKRTVKRNVQIFYPNDEKIADYMLSK